jgi:4-hydroxybenzoate polyprenyltransferase
VTSITRPAFWSAYLTTMRPYLMPVSGMAGLAGMSLTSSLSPFRAAAAILVFLASYGLGQALTDCFQRDTDTLSAPERPLVQGRVSPRQVLAVSAAGFVFCLVVLARLNPWTVLVAAAGVLGLLIYSPLKRIWWAGPGTNSLVVALLPVLGWLTRADHDLHSVVRQPALIAAAVAAFFAYNNFVLVGYLKDVSADRQTGYVTFPVRFGWKATAWASHGHALIAIAAAAAAIRLAAARAAPVPAPVPGQALAAAHAVAAWVILAAAALLSIRTQAWLHRIDREDQAHGPIVNTVRVFLLLMAAIVAAGAPAWSAVAAGMYLLFEVLVRRRPDKRQV